MKILPNSLKKFVVYLKKENEIIVTTLTDL